MTATLNLPIAAWAAAYAVTCPHCHAQPGTWCTSTGGGNHAYVKTHAARAARVAHWHPDLIDQAAELVRPLTRIGRNDWPDSAADELVRLDALALPMPAPQAKQPTPRGVRLSEAQAERIEWAAQSGGRYTVSTAHFHGDHLDRQSINALEAKGILTQTGTDPDGYERVMELTEFGWQVYRQHRLIIRRDGVQTPTR